MLLRSITRTAVLAASILWLGLAQAVAQTADQIDWKRAQQIHQKFVRGEKLTDEEQAYHDQAAKALQAKAGEAAGRRDRLEPSPADSSEVRPGREAHRRGAGVSRPGRQSIAGQSQAGNQIAAGQAARWTEAAVRHDRRGSLQGPGRRPLRRRQERTAREASSGGHASKPS